LTLFANPPVVTVAETVIADPLVPVTATASGAVADGFPIGKNALAGEIPSPKMDAVEARMTATDAPPKRVIFCKGDPFAKT
jgi:hypothetical protein